MENKDLKIGDLVCVKKNSISRSIYSHSPLEKLGMGVIIQKLTELFVFSHDNDKLVNELNLNKDYESIRRDMKAKFPSPNVVKTRICKVYWFTIEKTKWEYEYDLCPPEEDDSNNATVL